MTPLFLTVLVVVIVIETGTVVNQLAYTTSYSNIFLSLCLPVCCLAYEFMIVFLCSCLFKRNRGGIIFYLFCLALRACVCVAVRVCIGMCVCVSVNKIPAKWMHWFGREFAKWLLTALARILLKLVTFGWRSSRQWHNIHFLIILCYLFLFWITALLFPIKLKFDTPLIYALCIIAFEIHENWMGRHSSFLRSFVYKYPNSYWTDKLHTWYQHATVATP